MRQEFPKQMFQRQKCPCKPLMYNSAGQMINNYLGTCSEVFISPQAVDLFCFLISYSKTKFTCLKFTLELDNYLNTADSTMLTSRTVTATSAEHAHRLHVHRDCKSHFHFSPPSPSAHCLSSREKMAEIAIQAERHRSWRVVRTVKFHCSTCMFLKHFFVGLVSMNMVILHSHGYEKNFLLTQMSLHHIIIRENKWGMWLAG